MLKKNLIVLDTNVFIRFLIEGDENNHKKAVEIFADIEAENVFALILESVFAEIVFILEKVYNVERKIITEHLSAIISLKGIRSNKKEVFLKALEIYQSNKMNIVDCILASNCILDDINIYSFDKKLMKIIQSHK